MAGGGLIFLMSANRWITVTILVISCLIEYTINFYKKQRRLTVDRKSYQPLALNYVPHWYLKDPLPRNVKQPVAITPPVNHHEDEDYESDDVSSTCICNKYGQCQFHEYGLSDYLLSHKEITEYKNISANFPINRTKPECFCVEHLRKEHETRWNYYATST
jgi:hypothetical protein